MPKPSVSTPNPSPQAVSWPKTASTPLHCAAVASPSSAGVYRWLPPTSPGGVDGDDFLRALDENAGVAGHCDRDRARAGSEDLLKQRVARVCDLRQDQGVTGIGGSVKGRPCSVGQGHEDGGPVAAKVHIGWGRQRAG